VNSPIRPKLKILAINRAMRNGHIARDRLVCSAMRLSFRSMLWLGTVHSHRAQRSRGLKEEFGSELIEIAFNILGKKNPPLFAAETDCRALRIQHHHAIIQSPRKKQSFIAANSCGIDVSSLTRPPHN